MIKLHEVYKLSDPRKNTQWYNIFVINFDEIWATL